MGRIYFYNDKKEQISKAIKEARDLVDVQNDLDKIEAAYNGIYGYNGFWIAENLDNEIRRKYNVDEMFELVNKIWPNNYVYNNSAGQIDEGTFWRKRLQQDYYGVLYHTAMKKVIIKSIEEFVEKVE